MSTIWLASFWYLDEVGDRAVLSFGTEEKAQQWIRNEIYIW
jgi:hypothetical protein